MDRRGARSIHRERRTGSGSTGSQPSCSGTAPPHKRRHHHRHPVLTPTIRKAVPQDGTGIDRRDAQGLGKDFTHDVFSSCECGSVCLQRPGCTVFEFNPSSGVCGTYIGGQHNLHTNEFQHQGWMICTQAVQSGENQESQVSLHNLARCTRSRPAATTGPLTSRRAP